MGVKGLREQNDSRGHYVLIGVLSLSFPSLLWPLNS